MDTRGHFLICRSWTWSRFRPNIRKFSSAWVSFITSFFINTEQDIKSAHCLVLEYYITCRNNKELVRKLSIPLSGSRDLYFATRFSQNAWGQFRSCLWKHNLSYWRSPSYNLMRIMHTIGASLLFGIIFWNHGNKM